MTGPSAPLTTSDIVARLRAAGCVYAEDEARLIIDAAGTPAELADLIDRRTAGEPLEHVVGWAEFCGLRIAVQPPVFVPRRRTELLVREAAAVGSRRSVVVDLCCGSGAIGAALAAAWGGIELYAVDIDPAAVRCARRNLTDAVPAAQVYEGDLFYPLPTQLRGRVDIIVVSAPYVPTDEIRLLPTEARSYEPRIALDGGSDGLDVVRRVIAAAASWLAPWGHLLVETSARQALGAVDAMAAAGLATRVASCDETDGTVVISTPPPVTGQ